VNQQINLYHPIFRRQEKKFSARAMLQASAVLVAGALLMYGFAWWQVGAFKRQLAQSERELLAATHQLEELVRTLGVKPVDPRLEQELRDYEARLTAADQIEAVMASGQFARSAGYSATFAALARQALPGLWLTGIAITGAGEQLSLRGRSTTPELVPRYLQKLSAEQTLSGTRFQVFQLTRADKPAPSGVPYLEFVVRTAAAEDETAAAGNEP
jgi:Tfp pilus assembly protein PilN